MKKQRNKMRANQKKAREKQTQRVTSARRELPRSQSASRDRMLAMNAAMSGHSLAAGLGAVALAQAMFWGKRKADVS
jgi:hypothetical protein